MYVFSTSHNDICQQGVDEGRRQVLADIAKIVHDAKESATLDTSISIADPCVTIEQGGVFMNKRNRGHINANWISKDKKSKGELCELRHEIGRAGRACCNCAYSDRCNEREDRR